MFARYRELIATKRVVLAAGCPRKCVGDKRAQGRNSTQSLESPIQLPIGRDLHRRDAGGRAALRSRDATRI
jgi:hypothetical protein